MPLENLEEQGLEKNPNLQTAQYKFLLTVPDFDENVETPEFPISARIIEAIAKDDMAPYYQQVCEELGWRFDKQVYEALHKKNLKDLEELNAAIEDAEKNLGEMEVRDAYLKRAEFYSRIGDKDKAVEEFRVTFNKTVSLGHRLDIVFHVIRLGLFFMDHDLILRNIEKARLLIEEGGDWDRRNRLKVYQGVYCIAIREFKTAAMLFLDTVSTFTSYELMDYQTFVRYTVYVSMISLSRKEVKEKLINGCEISEVLHSDDETKDYLLSLFDCQYADFFKNLAKVEKLMKRDYLFYPHYRYYVREMRGLAYAQLLESYSSLTLKYMAESFGVSTEYIDEELSRFIASGRLHCKIDRIGGIVETNRPDQKNGQFHAVLKQGDLLLNRVQKLSRVINI